MTERVVFARQLDVWRKLLPTEIDRPFTARCERTAGRQVRQVRWQSRDLIEPALLVGGITHRTEQASSVRIAWPFEEFVGRRLFEHLADPPRSYVVGQAGG